MCSFEEHASRVHRLLEKVNTDKVYVDESYSEEIANCEELEHRSRVCISLVRYYQFK